MAFLALWYIYNKGVINMKNKFYSKEEKDFLKENIEKFGAEICAKKLERSQSSVIIQCYRIMGHCKFACNASPEEIEKLEFKNGLKTLDINFETSKHPKELAYFLGYFWADGYIDKHNSLRIEITSEDANKIFHIFDRICSFNLYTRKRKNRKAQTTFYTSGVENGFLLRKLGKYTKSLESHEKIFNFIPKQFHKYFIRGLIDGDGNFYIDENAFMKKKYLRVFFSIASRLNQDWSYLMKVLKEFGLTKTIAKNRKFKNSTGSIILNTNPIEIYKFIEEIYTDDDGIYLPRKFEKIKKIKSIINEKKNIDNT